MKEKTFDLIEVLVVGVLTLLVMALFFKWIWNLFVPETFDLPELTYANSVGMCALSNILTSKSKKQYA